MDADRRLSGSALRSELARLSLCGPREEFDRRLAWVNSICILILLVGILGSKRGSISMSGPPPMEEAVPAIVEPLAPPPQAAPETRTQEQSDQEKPDTPQVVVVTPDAPNINFSVPTIGNLMVPNAIVTAPPLNPMRPVAPLKRQPVSLENTGGSGERPQPPYPRIALEQGQQGKVTLLIAADDSGNITSIEVKESSGFPMLDRSALEHVKRHWILPRGTSTRLFETSINYRLERN
jgi:TonB family protein